MPIMNSKILAASLIVYVIVGLVGYNAFTYSDRVDASNIYEKERVRTSSRRRLKREHDENDGKIRDKFQASSDDQRQPLSDLESIEQLRPVIDDQILLDYVMRKAVENIKRRVSEIKEIQTEKRLSNLGGDYYHGVVVIGKRQKGKNRNKRIN